MSKQKSTIKREDIEEARKNFPKDKEYIVSPRITNSPFFSQLGTNLKLVRINEGPLGSFKDRGSFNSTFIFLNNYFREVLKQYMGGEQQNNSISPIASLGNLSHKKFRFAAASEGNHSQGYALAVKYFAEQGYDVRGTIFMPAMAPLSKRRQTLERGGAKIIKDKDGNLSCNGGYLDLKLVLGIVTNLDETKEIIYAQNPLASDEKIKKETNKYIRKFGKNFREAIYDDALNAAEAMKKNNEVDHLVHTFDDKDIIAGQGTVALDIEKKATSNNYSVYCAVGGGGLAAGMSPICPNVKGMQIQWMPSMVEALKKVEGDSPSPISLLETSHHSGHVKYKNKKVGDLTVDGATIAKAGTLTSKIIYDNKVDVGLCNANEIAYVFYKFLKHEVGIDINAGDAKWQIKQRKKQIPELASILPLVGVMQDSEYLKQETFVVLSGGNISEEKIFKIAKIGWQLEQEVLKDLNIPSKKADNIDTFKKIMNQIQCSEKGYLHTRDKLESPTTNKFFQHSRL